VATIRNQFSDEEFAEIRAATQEAERLTGGELVCVIVQQCDSYEASPWKATAFGALGGSMLAGLWLTFGEVWGPGVLPWVLLPPVLGAAAGLLMISAMPALARYLIPAAVLERRVDRRAAQAFLEEDIFDTRDRTGVLLFVALYERAIRILCDTGIGEKVPQESWNDVLVDLTHGLKHDRKGPAIAAAVRACGQVLVEHQIARRDDDENELNDEPRLVDG
jgi:putative membrane protein